MDSKYLVINADDLGFSPDINAAIENLHQAGLVTNASLMVDGAHLDDALAVIARNPRLGVGLHLDLCPAVGLYRLPYQEMRASLSTPEARRLVADEVTRQITRFKETGLEFTHLDGHRHFHALPELFELVVDTAAAHGLRTIRLTKDWILPRTPSVFWDDAMMRDAGDLLARRGVAHCGTFIYGWRDYSAADFMPGWNELMVHVGYDDEHYRREFNLLSSDTFRQGVQRSGVELKTFRDLAQLAAR